MVTKEQNDFPNGTWHYTKSLELKWPGASDDVKDTTGPIRGLMKRCIKKIKAQTSLHKMVFSLVPYGISDSKQS